MSTPMIHLPLTILEAECGHEGAEAYGLLSSTADLNRKIRSVIADQMMVQLDALMAGDGPANYSNASVANGTP